MGKVKNILQSKESGYSVHSVDPGVTVFRAIQIMCEKNIGGLLITNNEKLVGIFTERDYARKLILKGKSSKDTLIKELMTENPVAVSSESSIDDCMQIMSSKRIRHLPVVDGGKLVGMISIGDVVRHVMAEQKEIIEHLEAYISR
jgi:CBS domain-containing protein